MSFINNNTLRCLISQLFRWWREGIQTAQLGNLCQGHVGSDFYVEIIRRSIVMGEVKENKNEKSIVDEHYEEEFEFPLWKLIKQIAEEKKISYSQASEIAVPQYVKNIRFGDIEYEDSVIEAREKEMTEKRIKDNVVLEEKQAGKQLKEV